MSEWISVNDRLPSREGLAQDESEYVLVAYDSAFTGHKYVGVCGFESGGFSEWDNFSVVSATRITHWMPMPEPPEEDKR